MTRFPTSDSSRRAVRWCASLSLAAVAWLAPATTADDGLRPLEAHPALGDLPARWAGATELMGVPGAAIVVVDAEGAWTWTYGRTRPGDDGRPVDADTMFYVASITKVYTATALVRLAEQGRLRLDDPIARHLPDVELPGGLDPAAITIEDLLAHRPGIDADVVAALDGFTGESTDERFRHWLARGSATGTTSYSNIHFALAGRIVERVTGRAWRDHLAEEIFTPLGMSRTTGYASVLYADPNGAFPTVWEEDGWAVAELVKSDRTMHAAGGLATSAGDLATWMRLHLGDAPAGGTRVLSPEASRSMHERRSILPEPEARTRRVTGYGLGWQVGTFVDPDGPVLVGHGGGFVGAAASLGLLPEHGAGVAVLCNGWGDAARWGDAAVADVLERLTGTAPPASLLDAAVARAERRRAAGRGPSSAPRSGTIPASALRRPLGTYAGWFRHEELGTIIVERRGGELAIALGQAGLAPVPTDEPDVFAVPGVFFDGRAWIRFVAGPTGAIDAVVLVARPIGEASFVR